MRGQPCGAARRHGAAGRATHGLVVLGAVRGFVGDRPGRSHADAARATDGPVSRAVAGGVAGVSRPAPAGGLGPVVVATGNATGLAPAPGHVHQPATLTGPRHAPVRSLRAVRPVRDASRRLCGLRPAASELPALVEPRNGALPGPLAVRVAGHHPRPLPAAREGLSVGAGVWGWGSAIAPTWGSGSIPACAGEPGTGQTGYQAPRVYPRVCGGTPWQQPWTAGQEGLSPRGRGNQAVARRSLQINGSIPACAGEPGERPGARGSHAVYPRVGGGTGAATSRTTTPPRSIPAWAGEPASSARRTRTVAVYPRVGGGTGMSSWKMSDIEGLSPRGRGNQSDDMPSVLLEGSIPAWAGEPAASGAGCFQPRVYPRVGGGTGCLLGCPEACRGLSPRGRGNL